MNLKRLLRPRSIAVFGGHEAANLIAQCDRMGYTGEIWPVNPRREELGGRHCFRDIADLPAVPDAAFIGVNRSTCIELVGELSRIGAGGAVVYASGFAETRGDGDEGTDLQRRLVAAAGDMPLLGPNCYGFINYLDGAPLWPDQHGGRRVGRGVAILAQSSNLVINLTMQQRGLPIAYVVTVGNQAQQDLATIARGLLDDDRVTAIGLYIEGIRNIRAFESFAATARERGVPVIALKPGHSEMARSVAMTHTASIAGSDAGSDAFLRRLGVARLESLPEFLETLKLLHVHGPLPGHAVGSMSCSGGDAALVADAAAAHGVELLALTDAQTARIRATLSDIVTVSNPLDYHTFIWGQREPLKATFHAMAACDFDLLLLVLDFPRSDYCDETDWLASADALTEVVAQTGARTALVASLPDNLSETRACDLIAHGVVPLSGLAEAMAAVSAAAFIGSSRRQTDVPLPVLGSEPLRGARHVHHETSAKQLLNRYGVAVPAGRVVVDVDGAVVAAEAVGYPVAVKITGAAHKTETGGVHLGLQDASAVRGAVAGLPDLGQGVLVEHMVTDAVFELVVGVTRDPEFGLLLTVGAGGVLVEILRDSVSLLLPTTETELRGALESLRMAALLHGHRGRPAADVDAAVAAILTIARFAGEHAGTLLELDVNPLLVGPLGHGATVADALIIMQEETT